MQDSYLTLKNISKKFPGVNALEKINLSVFQKGVLGIAGENGAGKSTLLKIIAGVYPPSEGMMYVGGNLYKPSSYYEAAKYGVSMVFQEQALVPTITVYENLFLSHENFFLKRFGWIDRKKMISEATRALESLKLHHIDPTKLTSDFNFEDRQMIEIAKAFTLKNLFDIKIPIILLDEPTAGLAHAEIAIFFSRIRELKDRASFIFISHRLSELLSISDRIAVFKDGENVGEMDPITGSEGQLHELMVGRKRDALYYKENLQKENYSRQEVILEVSDLSSSSFKDISFKLAKQEILGIGGVLGCGKEELGRAIMGIHPYHGGSVFLKGKLLRRPNLSKIVKQGIGYIPKERKLEGMIPYLQVSWNITLASLLNIARFSFSFLSPRKEKKISKEYVDKLHIRTPGLTFLCNNLSGGNQQKVVLAKWILRNSDILILDNPTRGIDVGVKEEIYELLRDLVNRNVSLILITDDLLELIGLSNRIIIMKDGRISREMRSPPENKPTEKELVSYMV
jgi:ribose transport system ATP-binding protein